MASSIFCLAIAVDKLLDPTTIVHSCVQKVRGSKQTGFYPLVLGKLRSGLIL